MRLLPGTYHRTRIVLRGRHDLTVAATRPGAAVLDERGLVPLDGQSGVVQIQNSSRITVRGLDIRGYRTTSMAKVPDRHLRHRARLPDHAGPQPRAPDGQRQPDARQLRHQRPRHRGLRPQPVAPDHPRPDPATTRSTTSHLGASESVVVNGNVTHWRITGNHIHDDNNIGIDAIGWEGDGARAGTATPPSTRPDAA